MLLGAVGKSITPNEGVSLKPAFEGKRLGRRHPIFWEHEGNRAVLDGRYKLVALSDKPWRLYDTVADRTEQHDLAAAQPDRLKNLASEWNDYAARANVLPIGGWKAPERGKGGGNFSKETHFDLKMDQHLRRAQAPAIAGRGFTITAKFDAQKPDGVIVAQGGTAVGYTLFLDKGKLIFLVRIHDELASIASTEPLTGPHTAVARLQHSGDMTLLLDGKTVAQAKAPGLIPSMPVDGLDVGSDTAGCVGPYSHDNQFGGTIDSVIIDLE
jgi:arylsulfatase